jgi:biopolymer transport protein ExbB/TolQ
MDTMVTASTVTTVLLVLVFVVLVLLLKRAHQLPADVLRLVRRQEAVAAQAERDTVLALTAVQVGACLRGLRDFERGTLQSAEQLQAASEQLVRRVEALNNIVKHATTMNRELHAAVEALEAVAAATAEGRTTLDDATQMLDASAPAMSRVRAILPAPAREEDAS